MEDMFDKDITVINQYTDNDHKKAYKVFSCPVKALYLK